MKKIILFIILLYAAPSWAANPAVIHSKIAKSSSSSAAITNTFDATATSGNLIYTYAICASASMTWTVPSGYTDTGTWINSTGNVYGRAAYKVSAGSETNVVWSASGTGGSCDGYDMYSGSYEVSNVAASPYDKRATVGSCDNCTSLSSGTTAALAQNTEICFATFGFYNGNGGTNPSMTALSNSYAITLEDHVAGGYGYNLSGYLVVTDGSGQSSTASWTTSQLRAAGLIECFKGSTATSVGTRNFSTLGVQ